MNDFINLLGADEVRRAASTMSSAADQMQRAASYMAETVERLNVIQNDFLVRLEEILNHE